MDGFQLTVIGKVVTDWQWQDDPARHERRGPVANDLDATEGSTRPATVVKRFIAACANATRWSAVTRPAVAPISLPAAEASPRG